VNYCWCFLDDLWVYVLGLMCFWVCFWIWLLLMVAVVDSVDVMFCCVSGFSRVLFCVFFVVEVFWVYMLVR